MEDLQRTKDMDTEKGNELRTVIQFITISNRI